MDDVVSKAARLTDKYPNACSDCYGSGIHCVFKSDSDWRVRNIRRALRLVAKATKKIEEVNAIHDEVTKRRTTPDQRVIGFVLHSEKTEVSFEPHNFTKDWALIELYDERIDWSTFEGNEVYVGTSLPYLCLHFISTSRLLHLSSRFPSPIFLSSVLTNHCFSLRRR